MLSHWIQVEEDCISVGRVPRSFVEQNHRRYLNGSTGKQGKRRVGVGGKERAERWRVLGNSQTTSIAVSLKRSCGWAGARSAAAATAALWQRPGNLCVCLCASVSVHRYARLHGCMANNAFVSIVNIHCLVSMCVFEAKKMCLHAVSGRDYNIDPHSILTRLAFLII